MLDRAMVADTEVVNLVQQMLGDEEAGWNIGTFGAIAEFHHVVGDLPAKPVEAPDGGELVTERGGIRSDVQPIAYEGLTKRPDGWTQGIAFCLPAEDARMHGRDVLTEIGVDHEALRDEDKNDVLFDLGVGTPHVDFCIRVGEPSLLNTLRACTGRSILDAMNPAMSAVKAAHPHRICLSRLGRVEVYQPIGSAATGMASPIGPHTHVLPGLLGTGRSHSANTPIPEGWMPALSLHPANPVTDRVGNARPFDGTAFEAFQNLLDAFGPPRLRRRKVAAWRSRPDGSRSSGLRSGREQNKPPGGTCGPAADAAYRERRSAPWGLAGCVRSRRRRGRRGCPRRMMPHGRPLTVISRTGGNVEA